MSTEALTLEAFAARALDFEEVRGILERQAWTSLGRRVARELAPLEDAEARAALARVREAVGEGPNLAGIADPFAGLDRARKAGRALEEDQLVVLRDLLEAYERVSDWLVAHARELPALAELARGRPDLEPLRDRIEEAVDERGRVRDAASPLLARLRKEASEAAAKIDKAVRAILARPGVKAVLSDPNAHRRGGRPVLAVRARSAGKVPGIVHDASQSGETVFVEPREVIAPGNRLAECHAEERREVERVLLELTRKVLDAREALEEACERLAKLELAWMSARWAKESGARVPNLPGEPGAGRGLVLRSARHPLLVEQAREGRLAEVVPIDLRLAGDFDVLIVTGPNTGGKTVALKTAGLAALMTRCGLPFPCAEGTTVPLYDGVVADIGDEQEIRQSLSTFSSHLARVKAGLARASEKTLFLLDELGAGTDPDEGAALSEAILEELLRRGTPTLATTHIGKLKEFAFRHPRAENACVEFDPEKLAPCYRLLIGTPGESGALVVARRMGVPEAVVARAQERLARRDAELHELMADVREARTQAERVRSEAEGRLEEASRASRAAEDKRQELERRGELLEAEAQRGIEERVREARGVLERARTLLDQIPPAQRERLAEVLRQADDELSGAALSERRREFLAGLKKGSYVYLPRYRQRCAVEKVDAKKREVSVQLGTMKLKVPFDEVTWYENL